MKVLLGQIALISVIWMGMAFFYNDMSEASKIVFYLVTSWLLYLIVIAISTWIKGRKQKEN